MIRERGHSGRPSVSEQVVGRVRESFLRSPRKPTRRASRELKVPQSTVNKILRKRLRLHPYKLQLVQKLHPEDKETRHAFCGNLQALMENDDDLLARIIFSDEATFHLNLYYKLIGFTPLCPQKILKTILTASLIQFYLFKSYMFRSRYRQLSG